MLPLKGLGWNFRALVLLYVLVLLLGRSTLEVCDVISYHSYCDPATVHDDIGRLWQKKWNATSDVRCCKVLNLIRNCLKCGSWVADGRIWTMSEWGVTKGLNLGWYSETVLNPVIGGAQSDDLE